MNLHANISWGRIVTHSNRKYVPPATISSILSRDDLDHHTAGDGNNMPTRRRDSLVAQPEYDLKQNSNVRKINLS